MSLINELLKKEQLNSQDEKIIIESFIEKYLKDNPDVLPKMTLRVMESEAKKIEKLKEQQFNLGLNFLSVYELFSEGQIHSSKMQSFSGLLGNSKMEKTYDKEIKDVIKKVKVVKAK